MDSQDSPVHIQFAKQEGGDSDKNFHSWTFQHTRWVYKHKLTKEENEEY